MLLLLLLLPKKHYSLPDDPYHDQWRQLIERKYPWILKFDILCDLLTRVKMNDLQMIIDQFDIESNKCIEVHPLHEKSCGKDYRHDIGKITQVQSHTIVLQKKREILVIRNIILVFILPVFIGCISGNKNTWFNMMITL